MHCIIFRKFARSVNRVYSRRIRASQYSATMMIIIWTSVAALLLIALTVLFKRRQGGVALNPQVFQKFVLDKVITISHDSFIFRFRLAHRNQRLGLPIGHHITVRANCPCENEKNELVQHSYTPITGDDERGYVDFLIKVYFANSHPAYPRGGRLSQYFYGMKPGDTIEMRGPKGNFIYEGNGVSRTNVPGSGWVTSTVDAFAMIAGGSGITPLLQIIHAIRKNPNDKTKVYLIYSNKSEDDILLRGQLDELARGLPNQIFVWYTLTRDVSPDWRFGKGRITEEMLREHIPLPNGQGRNDAVGGRISSARMKALICGPSQMVQFTVKPSLEKLGYKQDMIFAF